MMNVTLADYLDHWPGGLMFQLFVLAIGIGSLAVIVLTLLVLRRSLWGRKRPIDEDLAKLKEELSQTAPAEIVNPIIKQLGSFITWDQLNALKLVDQAQADRRFEALEDQLRKIELDLTRDIERFHGEAVAIWKNAEAQREGIHNRINVLSPILYRLEGHLLALRGQPLPAHEPV